VRKRTVWVVVTVIASLAIDAGTISAGGFRKDPDTLVDAGQLQAVVAQLIAPDSTIGDTDLTAAGVGSDPVGVDLATDSYVASPMTDPGTRWVDNTPMDGDCPQAAYLTIQSAINASGPNDTVKVCPGTYSEQVRIVGHNHDGLKLESLTPLQAVIQWPASESFPLALVTFNNADGVTVRGFTITGPFTFPACSPDRHEGLLVDNAFNERIDHNHITNIRNSLGLLRGCQEGDAVSIGRRTDPTQMGFVGITPGSARVDHNQIDDYQKNGVQAINTGTSATVDHDVITGPGATMQPYAAPNGVVVFRNAAATVDHNVISKNHWVAPLSNAVILIAAPPGSSSVDHNQIFDNDYGMEIDTQTNAAISHNDIFGNLSDAIDICGDITFGCGPATGLVVRSNDIHNNGGSGIALFGANANLLKSNHINNNGLIPDDSTDGIRVDTSSMNNQILDNHMQSNITHDCHDDSAGSGTAGTANTWQGDRGDTENRPGLCTPN